MNFKQWLISESMTISDALQVLELEPDFTEEQLKTAFRQKSKLHHTDKGGDLQASINVNTAHAILKNSLQKATTSLVVGSRRWEELKDTDHYTLRMWGLDPDKKHTVFDIHAAEEEYQQKMKDRAKASKPPENVSNIKKEVKTILNRISLANIKAAIMIFKTEESLIDNYQPDLTDTRGNYQSHDFEDKQNFEIYKSIKLKEMPSDKLRNILFNLLVKKFIKKQEKSGIILMKDALKPWNELIRFLKKFDLRGSIPPYVDWRNSTLSNIVRTEIHF